MHRLDDRPIVLVVIAISLLLVQTRDGLAATVTISDGTFNPLDWTHTPIVVQNGATFETHQALTGGNPGAYQAGTHSNPSGSFIEVGHLYVAGGTYVPSTDGAISNLAVSIDAEITGILNAGETMGLEFIVQQDGTWYTSFLTFVEGIASGWQHIGPVTLTANDFQIKNETGTFAGGPNFTLSGTSLTFGYATWDGNPVGSNGASAVGWGVDNFNVTLNTVPEPSTYALAILGALSLAAFGRRVRCMSNSQRRRVESGMLLLD